MSHDQVHIQLKDVTLTYELHHDRTNTLKEWIINLFHRRQFVEQKKTHFNALENLTLELKQGERVGIIGPNGAGKSTLLKVISGILKPSAGFLEVRGGIQPLIEIAAGFNPEFSGRENIYLNGYMLGFSRDQIQNKEEEIIEFAGLRDFMDVPIKYYSSGMSVRLAFAIATSIDPEILLFDEMLSAGDAAFQQKAEERIKGLLDRAKLMLIVSHDLNTIKRLSNRVIYLKNGQIIFDGEPELAVEVYLKSLESVVV